ncbi:MAG: hypothetical protein NTU62_09090 [Spirochaetes bacterium]|nr:hypothetical protein [Spirochaetota bacterium]
MEKKRAAFMQRILEQIDELERELGRTRADWQERKGVFHDEGYVYRENLALLDEEVRGVHRTREALAGMDLSEFTEVDDLRARVISELEDRYDSSMHMRSGIAIIINLVRRLPACL